MTPLRLRGAYIYHRVCERGRDCHCHPPHQSTQEVFAFASDQAADQPTIQLRNIQTDQSPEDQEDGVADEQPKLLTPPSRNDNFQEPEEVSEEVAIELNLLARGSFALGRACTWLPPGFGMAGRCSLLFGYGDAYTVDQGDEKGEIYGARDTCPMLQVEGGELVDDSLKRAVRGQELRLRSHVELGSRLSGASGRAGLELDGVACSRKGRSDGR